MARQIKLARAWCEKHGYELDLAHHFHDAGKSGFTGANAKTGALKRLRDMLQTGMIPRGSILILENLDRLTRQDLTIAVPMLIELVTGGLEVVTLDDGARWTEEGLKDQSKFIWSVMMLARGHGESARKSDLVRSAFARNRDERSSQIFGSAPGWLKRADKKSPWKVIPEYAAVVRRVFELAAEGMGARQIAKLANAEQWPVPTRLAKQEHGWHERLPQWLLKNRTVLGEHEYRLRGHEQQSKHWHGEPTGIVLPNFYPRIVDDELWYRAQSAINARRRAPPKRSPASFNIWGGLMFCGRCGTSMHRRTGIRRGDTYYPNLGTMRCASAAAGKSDCPSVSTHMDKALLLQIFASGNAYVQAPGTLTELVARELQDAKARLAEINAAADEISELVTRTRGVLPAFTKKAEDLAQKSLIQSARIDELTGKLMSLQAEGGYFDSAYAAAVLEVLYESGQTAVAVRAECNARLSKAIRAIWVFPYDCAVVQYHDGLYLHVVPLPKRNARTKSRKSPERFRQVVPAPLRYSVTWRAYLSDWSHDQPYLKRFMNFGVKVSDLPPPKFGTRPVDNA